MTADKTSRVLRFPELAVRACVVTAVRRLGTPGILLTVHGQDMIVRAQDDQEADRWLMMVEMAMIDTPLVTPEAEP